LIVIPLEAERSCRARPRAGHSRLWLRNYGVDARHKAGTTTSHIDFTISRSLNFCSLPVEVFGISANRMWRGHLYEARFFLHQAMRSSALAVLPGLSSTTAHGVSPHFSSGLATTATTWTAGCLYSASSTSIEEMFSPPEMMMSLERSLSWI